MNRDFWGFHDTRDLKKDTKDMPDTILKEQIAMLSDKSDGVLYGKPTYLKIKNPDVEYKLATVFDIVVPTLDNYSTNILIMYSNPETEYPIAISVSSSYEEDIEFFVPKYTCRNFDEFTKAVGDILSSFEVINKIKILYSKATTIY